MIPLVVMMILQLFIPHLENVRSEVIDEMKINKNEGNIVEFDKNLAITGSVFCLTVGFYFLFVIYAGWHGIKKEWI